MRRLIEPSHLDLCCLQKPTIIACGSERFKLYVITMFAVAFLVLHVRLFKHVMSIICVISENLK